MFAFDQRERCKENENESNLYPSANRDDMGDGKLNMGAEARRQLIARLKTQKVENVINEVEGTK